MTGHLKDEVTPLSVTIIGGYLGAGKTTLVNHLLRHADGRRLAILVNEFGELPIDEDLIEAEGDDLISLSGGCVCCSFGDDLATALSDLSKLTPRPDHVVLEASGVALPGGIVSTLSLLSDYSLGGVVVLADAETVQERAQDKYMADTVLRQLNDADIVLLSKVDLVDEETQRAVNQWLQGRAEGARIIPMTQGVIAPELLLDGPVLGTDVLKPKANNGFHASAQMHTQTLPMDQPVIPADFAQGLIDTNDKLVRAKGFVADGDGDLWTIQIVGKRWDMSPAPNGAQPGMVLISNGPSQG